MSLIQEFKKKYPNLNAIVIVIAVVLVWRSVWSLVDLYLFPTNPLYSYLIGGIIGIIILLIDDMRLDELHDTPILEEHETKFEHKEKD
jgi:hypothetical protein